MTKKQLVFYKTYVRANTYSLNEVYKTCSVAKQRAEEWNRRKCYELNGCGFKVFSANTFTFTAAFEYLDAETGEIRLWYNTGYNIYDFKI